MNPFYFGPETLFGVKKTNGHFSIWFGKKVIWFHGPFFRYRYDVLIQTGDIEFFDFI